MEGKLVSEDLQLNFDKTVLVSRCAEEKSYGNDEKIMEMGSVIIVVSI